MRTAPPDKRTRLIETATKLAYGRGFRETSLADIAEAARVPVGNVYYYFKTKEELAEAVVERRLEEFRALREELDRLSSPKERLFAFVESVHRNREQLAHGGCPLGGLCTELHKEGGDLAKKSAALFTEPMRWLEEQFRAIGHEKIDPFPAVTAKRVRLHILSSTSEAHIREFQLYDWSHLGRH